MAKVKEENLEKLDLLFDAVQRHAGREGLGRFCEACAGVQLYVPAKPAVDHVIVKILGDKAAKAVCDDLCITPEGQRPVGLGQVLMPLTGFSYGFRLGERVDQFLIAGDKKPGEIAMELKCHERTVWRRRSLLRRKGVLPHKNQGSGQ